MLLGDTALGTCCVELAANFSLQCQHIATVIALASKRVTGVLHHDFVFLFVFLRDVTHPAVRYPFGFLFNAAHYHGVGFKRGFTNQLRHFIGELVQPAD